MDVTAPAPTRARARLPLRRPEGERWLGGVAAGLAAHLELPVAMVRVAFVVLAPLAGTGLVLYAFWWLTVPPGDPRDAAARERPSALTRLARRPDDDGAETGRHRRWPVTDIALGGLLLVVAAALVAVRSGRLQAAWLLPALVLLAGLTLAWGQLDSMQRGRLRSRAGGRTPVSVLRLLGGVVLAGVGVLLLVGQGTGRGIDAMTLLQAALASLAVLAGVALVLAPWWLRLVRELGDERAARARESERADIAAHLHDSVLQTLALIRARADDPGEVARMARAQERELREWLYSDRPAPGTSLAAALRAVVAEVEDSRSGPGGEAVAIDSVVVGDRVPDPDTAALLQATREALVNAVVHGRPPVSLYLECGDELVEVFVRDRGDGFDPDAISQDRFGVRESIIGRIRRRGGTAEVVSRPGRGTEVHLTVRVEQPAQSDPVEQSEQAQRSEGEA
ncbi:ATP-binding protein [Cellulomonas composti]|uniref:Putative two-component system sensor kinase n=1 Tax=Cellulomonas composti TaxID=266130 RepID=A0A511J965_9CELL|nr:ATP-binding protein [Cellulomonas composti]GEL94528.1 putative two-component system sensor kinase [Cellulomonas composti]